MANCGCSTRLLAFIGNKNVRYLLTNGVTMVTLQALYSKTV
jgi:hypothetical protein